MPPPPLPPSVMPRGGRKPRRLPRRTKPVPIGPVSDIDTFVERLALVAEDTALGVFGGVIGRYLDSIRWVEMSVYLASIGTAVTALLDFLKVPDQAAHKVTVFVIAAALACYLRNPKRKPWAEDAEAGAAPREPADGDGD